MPFNAIPSKDFFNRETDAALLKDLAASGRRPTAGNILLEAGRGMGKTELLRQVHSTLFWEEGNSVPFYYSFRRASLKADHFARDYFGRFVRQYLAQAKKDPSLAENMSAPLSRLVPVMHSLKLRWMVDLVDDFQEHLRNSDAQGLVLGAISAPLTAAINGGKRVFVMLDDFHLANQIFEAVPGDLYWPLGLFADTLSASLCPHVLTGSPEGALESLFTDSSFRGKAERMFIGPLPEDAACLLFASLCNRFGIRDDREVSRKFMNFLGGNPLYIVNVARSLQKMQKKNITERDLRECYSYEVSQGETFFYWSSVLGEFLSSTAGRRMAAGILMQSAGAEIDPYDAGALSKVLGVARSSLEPALNAVSLSGMLETLFAKPKDCVLRDFIRSFYMKEVERLKNSKVREVIQSAYLPAAGAGSHFEMVVPMTPDAELVAAKAFEQMAKTINLDPDVRDQIQLAVIESCINAMEHSGSHDRRIFLCFSLYRDKLEITVESPGKSFEAYEEETSETKEQISSDGKRGRGLRLMRGIMDDVRTERMADRTRVIMIKNISHSEVLHDSDEF